MVEAQSTLTLEEMREASARALESGLCTPELKRAVRDPQNAATLDAYLERHAAYVFALAQTQSEDCRALTAAYVLALAHASPYTAESAKRVSEAALAYLEAQTANARRVSEAALAYADAYNALLLAVTTLAIRRPGKTN